MPSPKKPCPTCGSLMAPQASQCRRCKPTYARTPAQRAALSERLTGQPRPWLVGRKRPEVGRKIAAAWTPEMREAARQRGILNAENREWLVKIAESLSGERNPNYQGKGQASPYAPGWGRKYRERIRARANGVCERCGARPDYPLDLHHRDFGTAEHDETNLWAICRSCHKLLHFANSDKT